LISCTAISYRGIDAGLNLKSTSGWNSGGNGTDLYGFRALPGGIRFYNGSFLSLGFNDYSWSSTEYATNRAWHRGLGSNNDGVSRLDFNKLGGISTRCLQD